MREDNALKLLAAGGAGWVPIRHALAHADATAVNVDRLACPGGRHTAAH